jgi:DNA-binding response OmpR family regulator
VIGGSLTNLAEATGTEGSPASSSSPHASHRVAGRAVHIVRSNGPQLVLFVGTLVRPDEELSAQLSRTGVRAVWISGLPQAFRAGAEIAFDAVVVDARVLDPPEETLVAQLRSRLGCPVLVVAGRADEVDEIVALEQGADGFLVLPVSARRLRAHVLALVRHNRWTAKVSP